MTGNYDIDGASLYHRAKSAWCAPTAPGALTLTLRTRARDVSVVNLVSFPRYGKPDFQYPPGRMEPLLRDDHYDYYRITLSDVPVKRLAYYFTLRKTPDSPEFVYTEQGLLSLEESRTPEGAAKSPFHYPYLHAGGIHHIPGWAKGAVVYEIFPDSFAGDAGEKNGGENTGGRLRGITGRIDHLAELGIDILYLTPIFRAHSRHKYDTIDYKAIDPDFGGPEDLRELVSRCRGRGIRVVLDGVFNHSGPLFAPFADVQRNGEASPYRDWFHILKSPFLHYTRLIEELESGRREAVHADGSTALPYETFAHTPMMPKLNTRNPEMKAYLLDAAAYWIREFGIDGWRLDVADEIDDDFWRDFRRHIRSVKPDALIIGEVWHDAGPWLQGDQFDGVMNYPFHDIAFDFFIHRSIDAPRAWRRLNALLVTNSPGVNHALWNMLDSHDTPRLIRQCVGNEKKALLLLSFMLTYVGSPLIYYGTEIGLDGGPDPDCRRPMPWNPEDWNHGIYSMVRGLTALRRKYPVLRRGEVRRLPRGFEESTGSGGELLCFERFDPRGELPSRRVLLNRSEETLVLDFPLDSLCDVSGGGDSGAVEDLISGAPFTGILEPFGVYVL